MKKLITLTLLTSFMNSYLCGCCPNSQKDLSVLEERITFLEQKVNSLEQSTQVSVLVPETLPDTPTTSGYTQEGTLENKNLTVLWNNTSVKTFSTLKDALANPTSVSYTNPKTGSIVNITLSGITLKSINVTCTPYGNDGFKFFSNQKNEWFKRVGDYMYTAMLSIIPESGTYMFEIGDSSGKIYYFKMDVKFE